MPLTGMLAEVTQTRVRGLLEKRTPKILNDDPAAVDQFEALVKNAAGQVVFLIGVDPGGTRVRGLAVDAIAYQTGSEIEYAQYPEQQAPGDSGRGWYLHQRYLELLADIKAALAANGGKVPDDDAPVTPVVALPSGRFPKPMGYPDPVRSYHQRPF